MVFYRTNMAKVQQTKPISYLTGIQGIPIREIDEIAIL
jgi:hypothetical protein